MKYDDDDDDDDGDDGDTAIPGSGVDEAMDNEEKEDKEEEEEEEEEKDDDDWLVAMLLRCGADRYALNASGKTAYDLAFERHRSGACVLLRYDPKVVNLSFMAAQGHVEAVAALLRQGVSPNQTWQPPPLPQQQQQQPDASASTIPKSLAPSDGNGSGGSEQHELYTALIAAASHRRTAVVELLLGTVPKEVKASVRSRCKSKTPDDDQRRHSPRKAQITIIPKD